MAWFKVDDGFANSKPVLRIPRRYRAQAVGLWVMAGTWCNKELTDGYVPDYTLDDFASTPAIAAHLVRAGLWENADGGWQFVGWSKYQFTKEQVLARRTAEAEKKQRARDAAKKRSEQEQIGFVPRGQHRDTAGSPHVVPPPSGLPDQTRPDPNPSLLTLGGGVTEAGVDQPPPICPKHGDNNADIPCHPCRRRREWAETREKFTQLVQLEQRRRIKELRENCPRCNGTNTYEIADGVAAKCDHESVAHG